MAKKGNDSLIMKVIDQIMGLCIKITWCKKHNDFLKYRGDWMCGF